MVSLLDDIEKNRWRIIGMSVAAVGTLLLAGYLLYPSDKKPEEERKERDVRNTVKAAIKSDPKGLREAITAHGLD